MHFKKTVLPLFTQPRLSIVGAWLADHRLAFRWHHHISKQQRLQGFLLLMLGMSVRWTRFKVNEERLCTRDITCQPLRLVVILKLYISSIVRITEVSPI